MSPAASIKVTDNSPRRIGVVEGDRRDKTRTVVVAFVARHPKYGKFTKRRTVLHVHDEKNESHVGDRVEVAECRPLSRTKNWTLIRVVTKAPMKLLAMTEEAGR